MAIRARAAEALGPGTVRIDREQDAGEYWEPSVWIIHRVSQGSAGVTTPEPCYAVRFAAADLFGSGDRTVTVDLWES